MKRPTRFLFSPVLSLEEIKELEKGTMLYHRYLRNADGTPQRWVVTSVKTWKTKPSKFEIGLKRGLYSFAKMCIIEQVECLSLSYQ